MTISRAARYNSSESTGLLRGKCTPNTRRNVIDGLHAWVHDPAGANAYWLNGMAGTGKTTIAYSFCAELEEVHALGASFFCSRSSSSCSDVTLIVPTIAYQLALFSNPFRSVLCKLLGDKLDICYRDVTVQFQHMIVNTLMDTYDSIPRNTVVVIDALDECSNQHDAALFLEALVKNVSRLPIKFCLSSRAEGAVYPLMMRKPGLCSVFHLHEVEQLFVKQDIELYVTRELFPISPSPSQINQLVQQAGRLFIYAATIIRYVKQTGFDNLSLDRLDRILRRSKGHDRLDALYATILSTTFNRPDLDEQERVDMLDVLHAVVCAKDPLTTDALGVLLRPNNPHSIQVAFKPFHSILNISETSGVVSILHVSFSDYLFNKKRAGQFFCDMNQENRRLARACFDRIGAVSPSFNICSLESSYVLDENVPGLPERINNIIPPDLFYACCHWITHIETADDLEVLTVLLNNFLSLRLLLWTEIMNLKKCINLALQLLLRIRRWSQRCTHDNALKALVQDACSFVASFSNSPASLSTPHIYISMLPLWPPKSPISECYTKRMQGLTKASGSSITRGPALLACWSVKVGGDWSIDSLAISPDCSCIAIGTRSENSQGVLDYGVAIWDVHNRHKVLEAWKGHGAPITSIAYSPDGTRIVSGSSGGVILVMDAHTGDILCGPLDGHTDQIHSVTYLLSGTLIVSGSLDGTIRGWSTSTGHMMFTLKSGNDPLCSLVCSPDSTSAASACNNGLISIWDLRTCGIKHVLHHDSYAGDPEVILLAYSPDSTKLVSCSDTQYIWDAGTGQKLAGPLHWHNSRPITHISYSPDGTHIVSSSLDATLCIWDACSGDQVAGPLEGHKYFVNLAMYTPDGAHIISSCSMGSVCVWDAHVARRSQGHKSTEGCSSSITSLAYSLDGAYIVSGSADRTVCVWDASTGRRIAGPLEGHSGDVQSVAFSPGGSHVVSGSADSTVFIWDIFMGRKVIGPLERHMGAVRSVAYFPDGTRIVSGSHDRTICIWDSQTGQIMLEPLRGHAGGIDSVACSPDSAYITSMANDHTIRLWDAFNGNCLWLFDDAGIPLSIAYTSDGQHLTSVSQDNTIRLWDMHTGQMWIEIPEECFEWVSGAQCSLNASRVASYAYSSIIVWDTYSGAMIAGPLPAEGRAAAYSVALSCDGTYVASGGGDGAIRAWRIDQIPSGQQPAWSLSDDGWVVDSLGQRLIWIPLDLRDELLLPGKVLHISTRGSFSLDFDNAFLGRSWSNVYTPGCVSE